MNICTSCKRILNTENKSGVDFFYLKLENVINLNKSMYSSDILFNPILDHDKFFCGLSCLRYWLEEQSEIRG